MICRRLVYLFAIIVSTAMFLHGFHGESMADDCPSLNVDKYKQSLLALQSEYAEFVNKVGRDNLRCNEVAVGGVVAILIARVEYLNSIDTILKQFCSLDSRQNHKEIWEEFSGLISRRMEAVHSENVNSREILDLSIAGKNRAVDVAKKVRDVVVEFDNKLPRVIK